MGRILALDIGEKRTGLAITDETLTISQPIPYTAGPDELIATILQISREYPLDKIVIGLPKTLGGQEGNQAAVVKKISQDINKQTGLSVEFMDERLTTKQAEMRNRDNLGVPVDSLAAQQLLQDYLQTKK